MFSSIVFYLSLLAPAPYVDAPSRNCGEPQWVSAPEVTNGVFRGTARMQCVVRTETDGDYVRFADAYLAEALREGTVHDGPKDAEFDGLPGQWLDVTIPVNQGGLNWVRSDTYFVTDASRFTAATLSKAISATGLAANLTRMDNALRLRRSGFRGEHLADLEAAVEVRRPSLLPTSLFKSLVKGQVEDELRSQGRQTVDYVAANL